MAKVQGPLMSLKAAGTLAGTITFQGRGTKTVVFIPRRPYDPKSEAQNRYRQYFAAATAYWRALPQDYKADWNSFVE